MNTPKKAKLALTENTLGTITAALRELPYRVAAPALEELFASVKELNTVEPDAPEEK